jgi:amino acid transporter
MRSAYVVSFGTTLLSVVALMGPTAYHRLRWRERNKERMLRAANLSTLAGMTLLAVAMTAAVYLVIDAVVNATWALLMTAVSAAAFLGVWLALPLSAPYDRWDDDVPEDDVRPRGDESAGRSSSG